MLRQWKLLITKYADRMLEGLDGLNWPESIKESQRNWIGKSDGAEITFTLDVPGQDNGKHNVTVFTTRPDTLFGATYLAISHELAQKWLDVGWQASDEVKKFITTLKDDEAARESTFNEIRDKKGIFTDVTAINPANNEEIPVWIANYVLSGYGTGAIMAVPAHDERDGDFAKTYGLPIRTVVNPKVTHPDVLGKGDKVQKKKVIAVLEHEGKFCSVNWKPELGGRLFIGGTMEEGEGPAVTALREIAEETGYTDVEIVSVGNEIFFYDYYAYSKKQAFAAEIHFVTAKLKSTAQKAQALESTEKGNFTIEWVTKEVAQKEIVNPPHKYAFEKYVAGIPFTGNGVLVNSGTHNGTDSVKAKEAITLAVGGTLTSQYRLKDWVFARQRYWGEPFPIVFDAEHRPYVVADTELPVILPEVESYEPTGTGESPLANIREWVEVYGMVDGNGEFVSLKKSDPKATLFTRETNTMPQWAGSSWYYLRYIDPNNTLSLIDKDKDKKWSPVDFYVGGAEHATRHLIYARFWHKFLYDIGVVNYEEPFLRLQHVGLIQAEDGRKMSKRWGNVINPDDVILRFGADTLRLYEMFMGPFDQAIAWSTDNMMGSRRFIERVWRLQEKVGESATLPSEMETVLHQTIKKVGDDIEVFSFNTAISQLMICVNQMEKLEKIPQGAYQDFLKLIAPFAPHVSQELWSLTGNAGEIYQTTWPTYNAAKTISETMTIAIQIGGKLRDTITLSRDSDESTITAAALALPSIQKWVNGSTPKRTIYVKGKILNIIL